MIFSNLPKSIKFLNHDYGFQERKKFMDSSKNKFSNVSFANINSMNAFLETMHSQSTRLRPQYVSEKDLILDR